MHGWANPTIGGGGCYNVFPLTPRLPGLSWLPGRLRHPFVGLGLALIGQQMILGGGPRLGGALLIVGAVLFAWASRTAGALTNAGADVAAPRVPASRVAHWTEMSALVAVTMLAAAFRLYHLTDLPPGLAPEEASLGLAAVASVSGDGGVSGWGGWPILHWLTVLSIDMLGHTAIGVRLPAVIGGILFAPALFLLGRQIGGPIVGATAGVLAAVTFWHVDATRGAWGYIAWGLTLEAVAMVLLLKAVRERRTSMAAFGGAALGLSLQVSWGALACAAALVVWLFHRRRQANSSSAPLLGRALTVPFAVYFLLAVAPIVIGLTVPDRAIAAPVSADIPTADTTSATLPTALGEVLLMLNVAGDPSPLHNLSGAPMLDRVSAPLFVVGGAVATSQLAARAQACCWSGYSAHWCQRFCRQNWLALTVSPLCTPSRQRCCSSRWRSPISAVATRPACDAAHAGTPICWC